jgi:hypothetical protein
MNKTAKIKGKNSEGKNSKGRRKTDTASITIT